MADIDTFKKLIGKLESNNNPNVKHKPVKVGVSKGDVAIGEHGMLPNTVKELANRARLAGESNLTDSFILNSNNSDITNMLTNNPELMDLYVNRLTKHVMEKSKNDPEDAYYRWVYGHNLKDDAVKAIKQKDPKIKERIDKAIKEENLMSIPKLPIDLPEEKYEDKPYTPIKNNLEKTMKLIKG